jgi:hypothetical protein
MTDDLDDAWITLNSEIAPEKLHALGVVTYRWNACEVALKSLLVGLTGAEFFNIWAIIHEMGDVAISSAAREILLWSKFPEPVVKAVEFGFKLYEANRINRNQLTHFIPAYVEGSDIARLKGPRFKPETFSDSTEDLRRVADDILELENYLSAVITNVYAPRNPGAILPPLPGIIPLPERLWKPPPPNPPKRKEQPDKDQG